jgi:hypothetical protein
MKTNTRQSKTAKKQVVTNTRPPLRTKLPIIIIGDDVIGTKDFIKFHLRGHPYAISEMQKIYQHIPRKEIYNAMKKATQEYNSMITAIMMLKRLGAEPTAYENDNDKLLKDIVDTHIIHLLLPCYMRSIKTNTQTKTDEQNVNNAIEKIHWRPKQCKCGSCVN